MGEQRGDECGPHGEAFDWEDAEDLTPLLEYELRARLEALTEEERVVIYRRARKHGRMEDVVIRAELVCCGTARDALAMSPEEPALVSLGGPAEGGGP